MLSIDRTNSPDAALLRQIRYWLSVVEHKNVTRAVEVLHVSHPTLSQQITQLEDTLRTPLLDCSGRAIALTDAGIAYLVYARRALQDLQAHRRVITIKDFNRETLVLLNPELVTRLQIERRCRQLGATLRVAIEVNTISAIVEIVRRGQG